MRERDRGFIYKNCISRCRFKAENCRLKDDGKSECSAMLENCVYQCEIDEPKRMLRGRRSQPLPDHKFYTPQEPHRFFD
jgi:hypothetical protein